MPDIPIYIDSPPATKVTKVFAEHHGELEDGALLMKGLRARNLHFTETPEQSKALDRLCGFHIVIAASGMCDAGRIRHRLKNRLWRDEATVLFTGYQAEGTLGRILQDAARSVRGRCASSARNAWCAPASARSTCIPGTLMAPNWRPGSRRACR